jgi:mRNA interferase MazF
MALKGEVHWAKLPAPVGRRPVLIIQNNKGNQYSPSTIVATISTSSPGVEYPFLVELDGCLLGEPCWVHCETILTIPQTVLDGHVGSLGHNDMSRIDEALKRSLSLK